MKTIRIILHKNIQITDSVSFSSVIVTDAFRQAYIQENNQQQFDMEFFFIFFLFFFFRIDMIYHRSVCVYLCMVYWSFR